jgi:Lon protease-like protein
VLFPGGRLPLRIFETRYMDMAKTCLRDGAPFGVCLIRAGAEVGAPATPFEVGTLAKIVEWDMAQLGLLQIVAQGGARFRILERRTQADGLQRAKVELLPGEAGDEPAWRLADRLPLPLALRQALLELADAQARLALLRDVARKLSSETS